MKARDVMSWPVVAASRTATVRDVAIQMILGGFSGLPVTERDGSVLGIVTEYDVIRALRAGEPVETLTAEALMTDEVVAVDAEAEIDEVMDILTTRKFLRVPVMENGRLVGVVSRPDILRALIEPNFMQFEGRGSE